MTESALFGIVVAIVASLTGCVCGVFIVDQAIVRMCSRRSPLISPLISPQLLDSTVDVVVADA